MFKYFFSGFFLASALGLTACGGDSDRTPEFEETAEPPSVIFNPALGEAPAPSDLQFASESQQDGTMSAGYNPSNPVIAGIDALDGNSVLGSFDIKFSESIDTTQNLDAASYIQTTGGVTPNPSQNVFLLPLEYPSGDGLLQASINGASVEVPTFAEALAYQTAVAQVGSGDPDTIAAGLATLASLASPTARAEIISLDGGSDNVLRINPIEPLQPKTKYLVALVNIDSAGGEPFQASNGYTSLKNTEDSYGPQLTAVAAAILGWEQLAAGYFGFKQTVFDSVGGGLAAPSGDDIIFTMTFTTGGTADVLQAVAAPETFFEASLSASYKQDAIVKLVSGVYGIDGSAAVGSSGTDVAIAATLNALLTSTTIPGTSTPNALYDASIATAIGDGLEFADFATNPTAMFIMQKAAAEAALSVQDGDGLSIAAEAIGTVQAVAAGASAPVPNIFPVPAARPSNFYRMDAASDINPLLAAPARIYQGEITLPYLLQAPTDSDPSPVKTSFWQASTVIGGILDVAQGNDPGTTPPSEKTSYRFPFPSGQTDVTVPVLVTTPDETTLGALGVTKPAAGWPVIIFAHGIVTERSTSLTMANALAFACIARDAEGNPTGPNPGVPCFATVAIDQPLHGIAPMGSLVPGLSSVNDPDVTITANVGDNTPSSSLRERHFDLTADATTNPIPMDYSADLGSSGSLFVNLTNFENNRDHLRQMVVDLLNLNASLSTMDLNDDGSSDDLDPANVYFIGHSLGAINGLAFVAINNSMATQNSIFSNLPSVNAAVGLNTGGGVVRLLTNSPSFAPTILGGLAAASDQLVQGNSALESYLNVFQGVLDSGDVTNFASMLADANSNTGVLLTEIVGDGTTDNPADTTIPNSADALWGGAPLSLTLPSGFMINQFPAPQAATEPMLAQFGATPTALGNSDDGDAAVLVSRFNQGSHGTPVSADNIDVFIEMVTQITTFFTLNGQVPGSIITNPAVMAE